MPAPQTCPRCGTSRSPKAIGGLCPVCLLRQSLAVFESPEPEPRAADVAALEAAGFTPLRSAIPSERFGDYRLENEVGRGGMGIIYRAHQISLNRKVALKMIVAGPLSSADFAKRLRVEAEVTAALDHPNIVAIHEVGEHQGQPFFTMRLVEGLNLAQALKAGSFEPRRAATVMITVARAVQHAHERGVLHRDLKPSNILLDPQGEPHVTDFGLAKIVHADSTLTLSQAALGTPSYMAPEQASGGSRQVTIAADVYSLGAVLYEMLTGRPLFEAETPVQAIQQILEREPQRPSRINPRIDRDLETICLKCLNKEPKRRYVSAAALADDLERWLGAKPIQARPVGRIEQGWLWCRRKPGLAALTALVAIFAGVVVVGTPIMLLRLAREQRKTERNLYAANLNLAQDSWLQNDVAHVRQMLQETASDPERGFEWYYCYRNSYCFHERCYYINNCCKISWCCFNIKRSL